MEKRWVKENFKIAILFSIKSVYFVTKVIHVYCRKLRKYILAKIINMRTPITLA